MSTRRAGREEGTTVARKDTSRAVLSMLSVAGSQTRPTAEDQPAEPWPVPASPPADRDRGRAPSGESGAPVAVAAPVTPLESAPGHTESAAETAPRTMRLRAATASRVRAAWLEAKRDDVLLTAQDFASNLVDEALAARRRRSKALHST